MWAEKDDGIIFQFNIQTLLITLFHITMPIVLIPLLISLLYFSHPQSQTTHRTTTTFTTTNSIHPPYNPHQPTH